MKFQRCSNCGSTDIDKQSGAMGVHSCNSCGSTSVRWVENTEVQSRRRKYDDDTYNTFNPVTGVLLGVVVGIFLCALVYVFIR